VNGFCDHEGLYLCMKVVLAISTPIALIHKVVSIVTQVSSLSSKGLSQVSLSSLDNPTKGHSLLFCPSGQFHHVF